MFRIRTKTRKNFRRPLTFSEFTNSSTKKEKKRPVQHEQKLQIQCVEWFRLHWPNELIFHIPNGKKRNAFEGLILKRMGTLSGVPDFFLARKSFCMKYAGLFIEMKVKYEDENGLIRRTRPDRNQQEIIALLRERGYKVEVVDNFEDFVKITSLYLRAA